MIKITYKEHQITSAIVDFLHKHRNSFKNFDNQDDMQKRVFMRRLMLKIKQLFSAYTESLDYEDMKYAYDIVGEFNKFNDEFNDEIYKCDFTIVQSSNLDLDNDDSGYYRFELGVNIHDCFVQITKYIRKRIKIDLCYYNQIIYF